MEHPLGSSEEYDVLDLRLYRSRLRVSQALAIGLDETGRADLATEFELIDRIEEEFELVVCSFCTKEVYRDPKEGPFGADFLCVSCAKEEKAIEEAAERRRVRDRRTRIRWLIGLVLVAAVLLSARLLWNYQALRFLDGG